MSDTSENSPKKRMISHCQEVYSYLAEMGDSAYQELENMKGLTNNNYNGILDKFLKTRKFLHKIISKLTEYSEDSTDIKNVCDKEEIKQKQDPVPKRNKFSLKKEKDEELTQDEFLQIYKIDMTEDLDAPCLDVTDMNKIPTTSNHDDGSNSDASSQAKSDLTIGTRKDEDDSNAELTDNLIEDGDDECLDEREILHNIDWDSSNSDTDDSSSLYSAETLILNNSQNRNAEEDINSDKTTDVEDEETLKQIETEIKETEDSTLARCSVVLTDCKKEGDQDEEIGRILNLWGLGNLNRKRKHSETTQSAKKSESKRQKSKSEASSNSDSSDSVEEGNVEAPKVDETSPPLCDGDSVLKGILDCVSDPGDIPEDYSPNKDSTSSTDTEKDKKKSTDKNVDINIVINEEDLEKLKDDKKKSKRKKWRSDKYLTWKLPDDSSDEEKENDPEHREKPKRRRKLRIKSEGKDSNTDGKSSATDLDSAGSDADNSSVVCLSIPTDSSSSSDIEFTMSAEGEKEQDASSEVTSGRRNIRTVQSFADLTATTKRAQMEEEERHERLQSQSQLLMDVSDESGLVLDLDKKTKRPLVVVDENITARMKEHQKEGVRFMWNICFESLEAMKTSPGSGCILAHCMGLGKSFQITALIHTLFSYEDINCRRILIVCPLSTVSNWDNEFSICEDVAKNKVNIKRWLLKDEKDKNSKYSKVRKWHQQNGVLILGYESFQSLLKVPKGSQVLTVPKKVVEALLDPGPDLVICDEGHLIKNGKINRTKTLSRIKSRRRVILTGTPMQNNLTEYFYMVDFVKPDLLGTKKEFSNRFINPIVNGGYEDSTEGDIKLMRKRSHVLHELLKDTVQRFEMSELQQYLPEKVDYVVFVRLQPLQIELYQAYMANIPKTREQKNWFFDDYNRLRRVWTHPCILSLHAKNTKRREVDTIIVEPEVAEETPDRWWQSRWPSDALTNIQYGSKMKIMLEIIRESMRLKDKVLIFGTSLAEMDAIEIFLDRHGYRKNESYLRMDGTVPPDKRVGYCKRFNKQDSSIKIFILSQRVGGLGLNLVAANRIIVMGVNFNPAVDNQSIFRSYRFGQCKCVYVYRLVSIGTMEEVIYERSITKQATSLRVVDEHQISRHYTSNNLQALYRFESYANVPRQPPKRPVDDVLAAILHRCADIFKYQCHEDLLENRPEEQLNEEEQRLAWDEFRKLQETPAYQDPFNARASTDSMGNAPTTEAGTVTTLPQPNQINQIPNLEVGPPNNFRPPTFTVGELRAHLVNNNNTQGQRLPFVPTPPHKWPIIRKLAPTASPANRVSTSTVGINTATGNSVRNSSDQRSQVTRPIIRNTIISRTGPAVNRHSIVPRAGANGAALSGPAVNRHFIVPRAGANGAAFSGPAVNRHSIVPRAGANGAAFSGPGFIRYPIIPRTGVNNAISSGPAVTRNSIVPRTGANGAISSEVVELD